MLPSDYPSDIADVVHKLIAPTSLKVSFDDLEKILRLITIFRAYIQKLNR